MRWLVYGGHGWVGRQLVSAIHETEKYATVVHGTSRLDASDDLLRELRDARPDRVVCAVGRVPGPSVDVGEYANMRDNFFSPVQLALCCVQRGLHLTYMGTSCIFDGDNLFSESDVSNVTGSGYTAAKGFVDRLFHDQFFSGKVLNVRIGAPLSDVPGDHNLITDIIRRNDTTYMLSSISVMSTVLPEVVRAAVALKSGTMNATNGGSISHHDVMVMYQMMVDPSFRLGPEGDDPVRGATVTSSLENVPNANDSLHAAIRKYRDNLPVADYVPRSVLITGGCGFIASHVLQALYITYPEATFVNVDSMTYAGNQLNVPPALRERSRGRYLHVCADICDAEAMNRVFSEHKIDTVLHFAAESHVGRSLDSSLVFTQTNVLGTHTLLQAAYVHRENLKRFIHVSTDEVYGDTSLSGAVTEKAPKNPTNPYAASKASAESLVNAYSIGFGLPCIITRGNNVYGPRQHPEKVIPLFITQALLDEPITIHGEGTAQRSFMHVDDVARAFLVIVQRGVVGETYNIGGDDEIAICDLADRIAALTRSKSEIVKIADRASNDQRYVVVTDKLTKLGWACTVEFSDGLRSTAEWYREHAGTHWPQPPL